jgi:hypothetical protein
MSAARTTPITRAALLLRSAERDEEQARIKRKLAELDGPRDPQLYGSRAPYPPPPDMTYRTMRDNGPAFVAEGFASRLGGKRGRSVVYVMTDEQHRALKASRCAATTRWAEPERSKVIDIDSFITNAGYRTTRTA